MTTIYKIKSSATRAAKAQFGEDWKEVTSIVEVKGGFQIQTEVAKSFDPAPVLKDVAVIEQLEAIEAEVKAKKAKKAEIESRKPAFIPSTPIVEAVAAIPAPIPEPISAPSEEIAPPDEMIVAQAEADKLANAQTVNVDAARPRMSTAEKPTKKVWHIADSMLNAKRKDVIEECVRQGIAYGTARTQYQHWFKCLNDSLAAPIATIGADGKITMPK